MRKGYAEGDEYWREAEWFGGGGLKGKDGREKQDHGKQNVRKRR